MLFKDHLSSDEAGVDVSDLAPSLYLIEVKSDTGKIIRKKLVKTD
jgi:hypothetical protein